MKINREESLKRVMERLSEFEKEDDERMPDPSEIDDGDLIAVYGTLLNARDKGHPVELADLEREIKRRAGRYVAQLLMSEGLLAVEEDKHDG